MKRKSLIAAGGLALAALGCGVSTPHTALTAAAAAGRIEEVRTLLAQGAEVNQKGGGCGAALHCAARGGHIDTIRVLLQAGANPDLGGGINGWTPVMHAIHKNQRRAVAALLEGGANVNASTKTGLTALMMAAGYGQPETVKLLLARGADPHLESADGSTALLAAVGGVADIDRFTLGSCQTETVKALLEADPALQLPNNLSGAGARWLARLGNCPEVLTMVKGL